MDGKQKKQGCICLQKNRNCIPGRCPCKNNCTNIPAYKPLPDPLAPPKAGTIENFLLRSGTAPTQGAHPPEGHNPALLGSQGDGSVAGSEDSIKTNPNKPAPKPASSKDSLPTALICRPTLTEDKDNDEDSIPPSEDDTRRFETQEDGAPAATRDPSLPPRHHPTRDPTIDNDLHFETAAQASQLNHPPEHKANLQAYKVTAADQQLDLVYGDHYHDNNGSQLAGDIDPGKDRKMQRLWLRTIQISPTWYKVPQGPVGCEFVKMYANKI